MKRRGDEQGGRTLRVVEAAFFDLDKTVIAKSSTLAFGRPMYRAGLLGKRSLAKVAFAQAFYSLYGADHGQLERARDQMLQLTAGWHRSEIESLVNETIHDIAEPLVFAEALFLIDEHTRAGRTVYIVSASPEEIVRPLARYVGVDNVIATRVRTDPEGRFIPELETYVMGEGKLEAIRDVAARNGVDLDKSFAYSDSVTDLPMLELVGNPVAVNPDRDLRKVAEEKEWPILEFQRSVSLRSRLARPAPIGATMTAAVAGAVAYAWLKRKQNG
ncbi:MAG: HAD-IB family hydrolase [Acidimicrobiia bacterium]|nr:HAD-IB family hydrolase [Acidimicrobiia bacterium]